MLTALCLWVLATADAPFVETPGPLVEARRLSEELRYEEALREYQRYFSLPSRPTREYAEALFDCGFLYFVMGDEASAFAHAHKALEQWPSLELPSRATAKQRTFLEEAQKRVEGVVTLTEVPLETSDEPETIRVKVADVQQRVRRLVLRHGLAVNGPFYAVSMACEGANCRSLIPPPLGSGNYSAFYFVEALDVEGNTLALLGSPFEPRKLSVVRPRPWHSYPWVWATVGTAVIAAGAVIYLLAPPDLAPTR